MWLLIFPSVLTAPNAKQNSLESVEAFVKNDMQGEPTLMQLAFSPEESDRLKL